MTNGRAICQDHCPKKTQKRNSIGKEVIRDPCPIWSRVRMQQKAFYFCTLTSETFLSLNEEVFDQLRLPISRLDQSSVSLIGQVDINSLNREKSTTQNCHCWNSCWFERNFRIGPQWKTFGPVTRENYRFFCLLNAHMKSVLQTYSPRVPLPIVEPQQQQWWGKWEKYFISLVWSIFSFSLPLA